ncbi:MAG: response regulator [Pirellulales bacterium]
MTSPYRIMLVEDSRTQAIKLTNEFERQGWQVDWAPTVQLALEKLNQNSPDLIVLDYYLPGIRGDELCRRIRMNINTRNISIVMLTMDDTHDAELHGLDSGADDFVPKSVDSDILLARIRTLLGKSRFQSSILGQADHHFRRARLLTIDDSLTYQQFLASELEKEGYQIETALSGRDGLDRILKETFDCALVDLVLPDIDGIEVCRRVNQSRQTTANSVTLLMLTGRESKEDLTQALEAGADDFVGKSSDMAVLKGRIRALLRRKFFQEENRRIAEELKNKELEMLHARAEKEMAQARAALNEELERRVVERTAQLAEANRNLEQKSRENEMFVYSVSHDLRSPLVNLQGFSKELAAVCQEIKGILAEDDLPPAAKERGLALLDRECAENIRFIQTAVSRLSSIIDALLRLSRAGRVEYQCQTVDVHGVVARIIDSMSATATERSARITLYDLPPAWGDPTAIEQVFANLIGNALNYLDPERPGVIEIGSDQAVLESHEQANCETYYVRDNGLGIREEYQSKMFQAFKRLHPEVAKGEGMGLAIVRRVVERHSGKIWVESKVGIGSTFYVVLPSGTADRSLSTNSP